MCSFLSVPFSVLDQTVSPPWSKKLIRGVNNFTRDNHSAGCIEPTKFRKRSTEKPERADQASNATLSDFFCLFSQPS